MIVFMFQPRFAPLVAAWSKRQTVRPIGKRGPTRIGDTVSLRAWIDKPYRSKQHELARGRLVGNDYVEIGMLTVTMAGRLLTDGQRESFARDDGFSSGMEMGVWFENVHGLPFTGVLYRWEPL